MAAEKPITFDSYADQSLVLDGQQQHDRLSTITHDAFKDTPDILTEQDQSDRFEAVAASLGDLSIPELIQA